jgi:Flavodoxin domain
MSLDYPAGRPVRGRLPALGRIVAEAQHRARWVGRSRPAREEAADMKALVVYESHYGNTEKIAEAIAQGIGPEARAVNTSEATPEVIADAELVVAGAPVMAFGLPGDQMLENMTRDTKAPEPPDVSHPSLRNWLDRLPHSTAAAAAFETRLRWSPGGATSAIDDRFHKAGFHTIAKPGKFVVKGSYGPLREGEVERAREWGATLAAALR